MATLTGGPGAQGVTLGQYLASIRKDRGMTLRQVEEGTDKEVSNAYLSQIENNKIQQPSPNVLHALSEVYAIDYGYIMELAGHITPAKARGDDQRHGRVATFADHNLTSEEEVELINYLEYLRSRKHSSGKTK
ncbi:helix-turn-helix domain-containing protein [Holophaga foetida]|uniref:helix-turn-helix domain-containing protein n=1 Tax=Holophaga foetida TaxID=35839 RepID=UPI00024742A3|nr:helix-turn-helix transcriptional regulator [Holophaga foetida]